MANVDLSEKHMLIANIIQEKKKTRKNIQFSIRKMYSLLEPFSIRTFSVSHFIHFPLFVNSVTFQNELIGELWYDLVLKASTPVTSPLPVVHCELGRYYISITMLLYISILRVLCCRLLYVVLYMMLVLY